MIKKTKKLKKLNPIAKDLRTLKYKQRLVTNKKIIIGKKKKIYFKIFRQTNFDLAIFLIHDIHQHAHH